MIRIYKKQIALLEDAIHDSFTDRMTASIAENFELDPTKELREEVKKYIAEAEKYEFEMEETIEQYLYLNWHYPVFKESPPPKAIMDILNYPDRDSQVKIDELIICLENI